MAQVVKYIIRLSVLATLFAHYTLHPADATSSPLTAVNPLYWYSPMQKKIFKLIMKKTLEDHIQNIARLLDTMRNILSTQQTLAHSCASAEAQEAYQILTQTPYDDDLERMHPLTSQYLRGQALVQQIFQGENPSQTYETVNDVVTYLYTLATREVNHPLDDFTLVVIDGELITTPTQSFQVPIKKLFLWLKQSPSCYPRISTHFPHFKIQQFGLDLSNPQLRSASGAPTKKLHLLFGQLTETTFFFKPEGHGLRGARHFLLHSGGYIISRIRKISLLRSLFKVASDDHPSFRNEVIPQIIMKIFKELLALIERSASQRNAIMKRIRHHGISEMITTLNLYSTQELNPSVAQLITTFTTSLQLIYNDTTLSCRIGHEIICTAEKMVSNS